MPYKLKISNEEVESELKKLGFQDLTEEMVESFRRDLLRLIKDDLKKLKKAKNHHKLRELRDFCGEDKVDRVLQFPTTSTPSTLLHEIEKEKIRDLEAESELEIRSSASSESTSKQALSLLSDFGSDDDDEAEVDRLKEKNGNVLLPSVVVGVSEEKQEKTSKSKLELPPYPEKPDPVNLYHFYKAHWNKFKAPGEDPRNTLRWKIRSKLFYSS